MPRKNSEDEAKTEDTAGPVSQIRRSSRIAQNSPTPLSMSSRRTSVSSTESAKSKSVEAEVGTPSKTGRASRSSSKSPTLLAKENEIKQSAGTPSKLRGRRSSASKVQDSGTRIDTPNPKNLRGRRRSVSSSSPPAVEQEKKEPAKTRGRRNSATEKNSGLEVIEEKEIVKVVENLGEETKPEKETNSTVKRKLDVAVLEVIEEQINMSESESPVKKDLVKISSKKSKEMEANSAVDDGAHKTSIDKKSTPIIKQTESKDSEKSDSNLEIKKGSESKISPSKSKSPNEKPVAAEKPDENKSENIKQSLAKSSIKSQKATVNADITKNPSPKKSKSDDTIQQEDSPSKMTRSKLALKKKYEEKQVEPQKEEESLVPSSKILRSSPRKKKDLSQEEKAEELIITENNESSSKILEDTISETELVVNDFKISTIDAELDKESDQAENKPNEPIEKSDDDVKQITEKCSDSLHMDIDEISEESDASLNLKLSVSQIESVDSLSTAEGTPKKQSTIKNVEKKTERPLSRLVVEVEKLSPEIISKQQKLSVNLETKTELDLLSKEKVKDNKEEVLKDIDDDTSSNLDKTKLADEGAFETPTKNIPTSEKLSNNSTCLDRETKPDEAEVVELTETIPKSPSEKVSTTEAKIDCEASALKVISKENEASSKQILSKPNLNLEPSTSLSKAGKSSLNDSKLATSESFTADEVEESLQEAFSTKKTISKSFESKEKKETLTNTSSIVIDENLEDIAAKLEDLLEEGGSNKNTSNTSKLDDYSEKAENVHTKDNFEEENGSTEDMLSTFVDNLKEPEENETKIHSVHIEDTNFDFDADTDDNNMSINTKSEEKIQTDTRKSPKKNIKRRKRSSKKSFTDNDASFKKDDLEDDSDIEKTKDVLIKDIKTSLTSDDINSAKKTKKTPKKQSENFANPPKTPNKSLQEDKSVTYDDRKLSDAISKLIANKSCNFDTSSSESGCDNEYLDTMAEEVEDEEDAPTVGSCDIVDEGESLHSTDTEINSNDSYAKDSFIDDENEGNVELLSGEEFDIDLEKPVKKKKRYTYQISDSSDDSVLEIKISSSDSETKKDENEKICKIKVDSKENIVETKIEPEEIPNIDLTSTEPRDSSKIISIKENINVQDIEDGQLSERISKVVDWFYTSVRNSGSRLSGNVSLNVSLDYDNSTNKASDERLSINQGKEETIEKTESSLQLIKRESTPKTTHGKILNLSQEVKTSPINKTNENTSMSKKKKRKSKSISISDNDGNKSETKMNKSSPFNEYISQKSNTSNSEKTQERQEVQTNISKAFDKNTNKKRKILYDSTNDMELNRQNVSENKSKRVKKIDRLDVSNDSIPSIKSPKSDVKIKQNNKKRPELKKNVAQVSEFPNTLNKYFAEEICDTSKLSLGDVKVAKAKVSNVETSGISKTKDKLKNKKIAAENIKESDSTKQSKSLKKKKIQDISEDDIVSPKIKKIKRHNSMEEAFEKHLKKKCLDVDLEAGPSNRQMVKAHKRDDKIKYFPKASLQQVDIKPDVTFKLYNNNSSESNPESNKWEVLSEIIKPSKRSMLHKDKPEKEESQNSDGIQKKPKLLIRMAHLRRRDLRTLLKRKPKTYKR